MSQQRLVVLGGSSPYTAALVDAIAARGVAIDPFELVLQGRNPTALALVAAYASHRLVAAGWTVTVCVDMREALQDAAIVVHQIRYGGLEGRAEGEALCAQLGVVADETLGPAALLTALSTASCVARTGELLARHAPAATVLNLTNPLSATTSLLLDQGVRRCVGLCELPRVTGEEVEAVLRLAPGSVTFDYAGLNHRGFLFDLRAQGRALLPELIRRQIPIGGVGHATMAAMDALPLKYFAVYRACERARPSNRAAQLDGLRNRLLSQLRADSTQSPPGLRERYLEWYPKSVVPMIEALGAKESSRHVVNALCTDSADARDGLVIECHAAVSRSGIAPCSRPRTIENAAVARWQHEVNRHERAFVAALREPSVTRCEEVLALDPLLPGAALPRALGELSRRSGL